MFRLLAERFKATTWVYTARSISIAGKDSFNILIVAGTWQLSLALQEGYTSVEGNLQLQLFLIGADPVSLTARSPP